MGGLIKLQEQIRKDFLYLVVVCGFGKPSTGLGGLGECRGNVPHTTNLFKFTNLVVATD